MDQVGISVVMVRLLQHRSKGIKIRVFQVPSVYIGDCGNLADNSRFARFEPQVLGESKNCFTISLSKFVD